MQLYSKPREARGIKPETFTRRGQLLAGPPTVCVSGRVHMPRAHKVTSMCVHGTAGLTMDGRRTRLMEQHSWRCTFIVN